MSLIYRNINCILPCKNGGTNIKEIIQHLINNDKCLTNDFEKDDIFSQDLIFPAMVFKSEPRISYIIFTDYKGFYVSYAYNNTNTNDIINIYSKKVFERHVKVRTQYIIKLGSNRLGN